LLVFELVSAIRNSHAPKIYICNVATQPGETDGYSIHDHVQAIETHTQFVDSALENAGEYLFDYVLANNNQNYPIPRAMSHLQPVLPILARGQDYQVITADIIDAERPWRHNPTKLANELMNWYKQLKS
jgi:uncharacterized cofD-like protein